MSYFSYFSLQREPFSTTPDPRFFYLSKPHKTALNRLEISIRLRRGLNVILGDIGSGKTSLARTMLNSFHKKEPFEFFLITDPGNTSEFQFLLSLIKVFNINPVGRSTLEYKNSIKNFLFRKNIEEGITPVLIVDEGQKLSPDFLEILRVFLNYETNDYKLLQLVIFGQLELLPRINSLENFADRIVLKTILKPLDLNDTTNMIFHRLKTAGCTHPENIFKRDAIKDIFDVSHGLPRKVTYLCCESLMNAIMEGKPAVDRETVSAVMIREDIWKQASVQLVT